MFCGVLVAFKPALKNAGKPEEASRRFWWLVVAGYWQVPSLKWLMWVLQMKSPLVLSHSVVYQMVQSSTGSTLAVA